MRMVGGVQWSEAWDDHSQTPEMLFAARNSAAFFGSFPQAFPPGAHWTYTSGGYQLLQHVLRRVMLITQATHRILLLAIYAHWAYICGSH